MSDRLTDIIVGLQRLAEGARIKGDDLEYTQREERNDHVRYLDQLIGMTRKLYSSLHEDRKRFVPENQPQVTVDRIPRVVAQGPAEDRQAG